MTITQKNESVVNTFLGRRKQVVAIVDPYSTGCLVAQEIAKRGYLLICVYSAGLTDIMKGHVVRPLPFCRKKEIHEQACIRFYIQQPSLLTIVFFFFAHSLSAVVP